MAKESTTQSLQPETIEIDINEASHAQLMWFSKFRNLDYDPAETHNQTLNRIRQSWEHATITVPKVIEEPRKPTQRLREGVKAEYTLEERYGLPETVYVMIPGTGDDSEDVEKISHNGTTYLIKKGEVVPLPWYVFKGCLDDAKMIVYSSGRDSGIGEPRYVQAIPFTRVK